MNQSDPIQANPMVFKPIQTYQNLSKPNLSKPVNAYYCILIVTHLVVPCTCFERPWWIYLKIQLVFAIFSLSSNMFLINLLAIFAVLGWVGHRNVVNFCCSDKFEKVGTSADISSNAIFLSLTNRVHPITKCCSSSTGDVGGPGCDGEDALVRGGEHGVLVGEVEGVGGKQ